MRFNNEEGETAADILNNYNEEDIANLIYKYGEERYSRGIAREIIAERRQRPIKTTFQLVEAIKRGVPFRYRTGHIHFATRTFQALRIVVNHELENVENGIKKAIETVRIGGRVAVISFHSLEDRIVKNIFREAAKKGEVALLVKKPVVAGLEEKKQNPNSRSAKLRVVIKN
jgi:16S rRNA (cytosine1402-N4)-methyltransferase